MTLDKFMDADDADDGRNDNEHNTTTEDGTRTDGGCDDSQDDVEDEGLPDCHECGADLSETGDPEWERVVDPRERGKGHTSTPVAYCEECGALVDYGTDVTLEIHLECGSPIDQARVLTSRVKANDPHRVMSDRQLEAYIYRDVCGVARQETADELGVSASRVDNALREARDKVKGARALVGALDEIDADR